MHPYHNSAWDLSSCSSELDFLHIFPEDTWAAMKLKEAYSLEEKL